MVFAEHAQSGFRTLCNNFAFNGIPALRWLSSDHGLTMTDAQQFEVFMQNYQNMVFSTAMRLLANHAEAEDVAQEVFLKAYERFDQLRDSPTVGGWLKTVATNLSLNHLSRYRARWTFFSEMFGKGGNDDQESEIEFVAPEDSNNQTGRREEVELALQKLHPAQR